MKSLIALIVAIPSLAQTLSISPTGEVRLDPKPERMAELYAADSPRADKWERVAEFAQTTHVPTNRTQFYRARVKDPPLKIVSITDSNQTLRGICDKRFYECTLLCMGKSNWGWSFFGKSGFRTNSGRVEVVTTRSDFSFHQIPVTQITPAVLTIVDEDDFILVTNVNLYPGPYVPLTDRLPVHPNPADRRPNGNQNPFPQVPKLSPASVGGAYAPTDSHWELLSHSGYQLEETFEYITRTCTNVSKYDGSWDVSTCRLTVTRDACYNGTATECGATFLGLGKTLQLSSSIGPCPWVDSRGYVAWPEVGTYDSATEGEEVADRFVHVGASDAWLWLGGQLRGTLESNYWVHVAVGIAQANDRTFDEVYWVDVPPQYIRAIGSNRSQDGTIDVQVPRSGLYLNVTPAVRRLTSAWCSYSVAWAVGVGEVGGQ